ncbi:hypothetical protein MUK42_04885 [Musa troglodytarum]|uniref:Uncharacterized protein n=1 Tax=Musa troglodytarum TaxID=320322 RepID=A0A9E7GF71_9LILI|nr:hypothetical protein MUK42_04885 [Musa troglodytarum]
MPIFLTRLSELRFWRRVSSLFRREEQEEKKISRVVLIGNCSRREESEAVFGFALLLRFLESSTTRAKNLNLVSLFRWERMPEARRATMGDFTGGFWIRRAAYPAAMPGSRRRRIQSFVAAIDNKENIHPSRAATARRRPRYGKSPLPSWYPRTPLRDITIIINALERRKRERAARARQRNADAEAAPVTNPAVDEVNAPEHTPVGEALPSDVSDASPSPAASSTLSSLVPTQQPLRTPSSSDAPLSSLVPTQQPLRTPSSSDAPLSTMKPTEFEAKLQSTISEMERLVLDNLKRTPKPPARKATRTLMSMR